MCVHCILPKYKIYDNKTIQYCNNTYKKHEEQQQHVHDEDC